MNRRSFLKLLGGTTVAAVAAPLIMPSTAPLYIPPERLDMGVPRRILTATELPPRPWRTTLTTPDGMTYTTRVVPMLLVNDEYAQPGWQQYGQRRVPAGTTLLVDRTTAERWIEHGVGTPGPKAPDDLQMASAKRQAERQQRTYTDYDWAPGVDEHWPTPWVPVTDHPSRKPDALDRMFQRALAKGEPSWWDSLPEMVPGRAPGAFCVFPKRPDDGMT